MRAGKRLAVNMSNRAVVDENDQVWIEIDDHVLCYVGKHFCTTKRYDEFCLEKGDKVVIDGTLYQVCSTAKVDGPADGPYFLIYAHKHVPVDSLDPEEWEELYG